MKERHFYKIGLYLIILSFATLVIAALLSYRSYHLSNDSDVSHLDSIRALKEDITRLESGIRSIEDQINRTPARIPQPDKPEERPAEEIAKKAPMMEEKIVLLEKQVDRLSQIIKLAGLERLLESRGSSHIAASAGSCGRHKKSL